MPIAALALTFIVGVPVTFLLHEAGHAMATWVVGGKVLRFQVGVRTPRWTRDALGVEWVLASGLTGARLLVSPRSVQGWRWRRVFIAMGGPLWSGGVGGIACALAAPWVFESTAALCLAVFGALNVLELTNLFPSSRRSTDGGTARAALRWTPADELDSALAHRLTWLQIAASHGRSDVADLAQGLSESGRGRFEGAVAQSVLQQLAGRPHEARDHLLRARELARDMGREGPAEAISKLLEATGSCHEAPSTRPSC